MLLRSHEFKSRKEKLEAFLKERSVWFLNGAIKVGSFYLWKDEGSVQWLEYQKDGNRVFVAHQDALLNQYYVANEGNTAIFTKYSRKNTLIFKTLLKRNNTIYLSQERLWFSKRGCIRIETPFTKQIFWF